MSDGYIQVPTDDVGKKVDTAELTRTDNTVVERQRVSIGDSTTFSAVAAVVDSELSVSEQTSSELLLQILDVLEDIRFILLSSK